MLLISIFIVFATIYFSIILFYCSAWAKLKHKKYDSSNCNKFELSVIIAFRNEENNLPDLLNSLHSQSLKNIEILLVNDHSTDNSAQIVRDAINNDNRIRLIELNENQKGKKQAILQAVLEANGEYLLFTDADCTMNENWAENMLNFAITSDADIVSGTVLFRNEKGFWNKILQLEFLSLINLGATSIIKNRATMCNAANMLIKKDVYLNHHKNIKAEISSGDDVFVLHSVKQNSGKIVFNESLESIVETSAPKSFKEFVSQRIRWASKSGNYKDFDSIFIGVITLLSNLNLLACLIISIIIPKFWICFAIVFVLKLLADTIFLYFPLKHYQLKYLYKYILLLSLFYPFYYIGIGILSLFYKPKWKDRKIS